MPNSPRPCSLSLRRKNTAIGTSVCVHEREGTAESARRLSHSCDKCWNRAKSVRGGRKTYYGRSALNCQLAVNRRRDQDQGNILLLHPPPRQRPSPLRCTTW